MEVSVISGGELFHCRQIYSKVAAELLRHDRVSKGTQHGPQWGREMSSVHVRRGLEQHTGIKREVKTIL
jgi:hypothetical protein